MSETTVAAAPDRAAVGHRSTTIASWSFVVAVVTVLTAGGVALWHFREWVPVSDLAVLELRLRQMPHDLPLVGAYSRYGWSHPGPLLDYLLWVPWRLLGGLGVGLLAGMLLLHVTAVGIAWAAVWRRSAAAAVLVAGSLLTVWAVGPGSNALIPWNPFTGMLLGGTLVVVAWNAADRGRVGAVLLLPVGTLLVQAHVGSTLLVVAACSAAIGLALISWGHKQPMPWRYWGASAAFTVLLWLPPLWDQFTGGGNLAAIAGTDSGPGLGLGRALTVVSDAFSVSPYWWSPDLPFLPESAHPPLLAVIPLCAAAVAVLRRDVAALRFVAVAAAAVVAALLSVWQIADTYQYLVVWMPAVVAVVVAVSLWILLDALGWDRAVVVVAPVLLILPAAGVAVNMLSNDAPLGQRSPRMVAAADVAVSSGFADRGVHLVVEPLDDDTALDWLPGVVSELERRGIETSADVPGTWPQPLKAIVGAPRGEHVPVLLRTVDSAAPEIPPGWQVAVTGDPFTADEWRELDRLQSIIDDPAADDQSRAYAAFGVADLRDGRVAWQVLVPKEST